MATPTNETGAPPDEPIDLDAWFGPARKPKRNFTDELFRIGAPFPPLITPLRK